jgi:hypothetical protein
LWSVLGPELQRARTCLEAIMIERRDIADRSFMTASEVAVDGGLAQL